MLKRIISSLALLISLFILLDHALLFPTYSNIPPTTDTCTYANDYFTFEYPENWSYQEFRSFLTLYDENNRLVANIWIGTSEKCSKIVSFLYTFLDVSVSLSNI